MQQAKLYRERVEIKSVLSNSQLCSLTRSVMGQIYRHEKNYSCRAFHFPSLVGSIILQYCCFNKYIKLGEEIGLLQEILALQISACLILINKLVIILIKL